MATNPVRWFRWNMNPEPMSLKEVIWRMRYFVAVYTALCTQEWYRKIVHDVVIGAMSFAHLFGFIWLNILKSIGPQILIMLSVGSGTLALIHLWNSNRDI